MGTFARPQVHGGRAPSHAPSEKGRPGPALADTHADVWEDRVASFSALTALPLSPWRVSVRQIIWRTWDDKTIPPPPAPRYPASRG